MLLVAWLLALTPVAGLACNVMVQVAHVRMGRGHRVLRSVFVGFAAGLLLTILLTAIALHQQAALPLEWFGHLTANALIFGALGYGYFHFINLGQTARRIRLLVEFVEADRPLSMEEVLERYNAREIIHNRLRRLLNSGQVVVRQDRYVIGKRTVLYMSRVLELMKLLILRKRSEFD